MKTLTLTAIKQARITAGFTQLQLSRIMGVEVKQVGRWERGEQKFSGTAKRLHKILTSEDKLKVIEDMLNLNN